MLDRCRDHRCLTKCHKQHRQNELDGQVDDPTRVGDLCDGGCQTHAGTRDVLPPVKNNTDRIKQLVC